MGLNFTRKLKMAGGQNGRWLYQGIYAFTTTGATKDVAVPMGRVESCVAFPIGTPASDEVLSANNTVSGTPGNDDAAIVGNGNGSTTITVTRTGAAKTSGLKFALWAIGQ
jgi:hypothetical protein